MIVDSCRAPLSFIPNRQSCDFESISEAEIVAKDISLRSFAYLVGMLLDDIFEGARAGIGGNSQEMLHVGKAGRNPTTGGLD